MAIRKLCPLTTLDCRQILIAPSILAADFAHLGQDVKAVEEAGADVIHIDIMDGHFVPNLSLGPGIVKAIRSSSSLPFDVHLMLSQPFRYVDAFVKAGADHITIHVESEGATACTLEQIRAHGCSAGLSLRPGTPASSLAPYMAWTDLILVMTVEPGFGGQSFMQEQVDKITEIRSMIQKSGRPIHLQVDGGIAPDTARKVLRAGANLLVAGSSIFREKANLAAAISCLRAAQ
ncbi:MAG: ribulose-phosphate 3-epimerase [Lentisphaeria bacterium]